jgi:hypothetical protein
MAVFIHPSVNFASSDFLEHLLGVTEGLGADFDLIHKRPKRRQYEQLTTPDEAARWYAVDPENPQARVIAFRPKVKRRKAE